MSDMFIQLFEAEPYIQEDMKGFMKGAGHLALDVAGFIPGVGEIADLGNALLYCTQTPPDYLFAAFSVISMVPEIGDIIGKGGKLAVWASKAMSRFPNATRIGARAARIIEDVNAKLKQHWKKVDMLLANIEKPPKEGEADHLKMLRPHLPAIREALRGFYGGKHANAQTQRVVQRTQQAMNWA